MTASLGRASAREGCPMTTATQLQPIIEELRTLRENE